LKINELIAATQGASNRILNIKDLTEEEIIRLHKRYRQLAEKAKSDGNPLLPHTVEEIEP
jgi:low affinity Fe/Cu permease